VTGGVHTAPSIDSRSEAHRVIRDLEALAKISDPGPGVTRVAYTERDSEGRAWFASRCEELGLRFEVDRFGNCFGWAPGCEYRPAVLVGSHLDSVRHAGAYDGVLGVLVGFEVVRAALVRDPDAAVAVVSFACEESSRFGIGAIGSRLLFGDLGEEALDAQVDLEGAKLRDVLVRAGLSPKARSSFDAARLACFLEVHIDQGSALADGSDIGIVSAIAGCVRLKMTFTGEAAHSGAHTRARRRNALLGAGRFVAAAEELWSEIEARQEIATITIGWIENKPNAPNSVAGQTDLVVDLRAPDPGVLRSAQRELQRRARTIAGAAQLELTTDTLGSIEPVVMAPGLVERLERAARERGIGHRRLPSLAGHDAEIVGSRVPTAMLFVANPNEVSHSPEEAMDEQSLAHALAVLDDVLSQAGQTGATTAAGGAG
jgi:hydantoinase/carbamoylase family amidase